MRKLYLLCLLLLCSLIGQAQKSQKDLYWELFHSLRKDTLDYHKLTGLIDQGADILYGPVIVSHPVGKKKPVSMLEIIPLPIILFTHNKRQAYKKYDDRTIYLDKILEDSNRSAARLQVIEYLLEKGADPTGGGVPRYERPVYHPATAISNGEFGIAKLFIERIVAEGKTPGGLRSLIDYGTQPQADGSIDSTRYQQMQEMLAYMIGKGADPYSYYQDVITEEQLAPLFFQYVPPSELDTSRVESPVKLAYKYDNLTLIKKYKAMGFVWEEEKGEALDQMMGGAIDGKSEVLDILEYYVKELGIDLNRVNLRNQETILCRAIRYTDVTFVKKLIELGIDLEKAGCNPFYLVSSKRKTFGEYAMLPSDKKDNKSMKKYLELKKIESYLYDLLASYPKSERKVLEKKFNLKEIRKQYQ
ncbi:MAG: hypothetical protein AAF734_00875 [Bacteroidota bacterium]